MSDKQAGPKVAKETIEELFNRVQMQAGQINPTTVIASAFLDGKFYLGSEIGACVSPENFDEELGRQIAFDKLHYSVVNKLWELEGYRLYRSLEQAEQSETSEEQPEDPA